MNRRKFIGWLAALPLIPVIKPSDPSALTEDSLLDVLGEMGRNPSRYYGLSIMEMLAKDQQRINELYRDLVGVNGFHIGLTPQKTDHSSTE